MMKRTTLAIVIGAICAGTSGSLMAQDTDTDNADRMDQQTRTVETNQARTNDDTMDVQVEREPAEVQVEQESPDITVEQSQPDVTIEQPEPEVTIEQPEPNVTVEQAEPNVNVEQQGQPDVEVEQADDANVDINENDDERQERNATANETDRADRAGHNDQDDTFMSQQVSDIEGTTVVNQNDEEIGDVEHIARHNGTGELFAIISVGGIWGLGSTDIALPLNEMQYDNDRLVMDTTYGSDEIEDSSDEYNEDDYTEVDGNMTLSEARQQ